ncbi:MAG: RlmE family RNA methyltransferase [Planctomycetota bacterium]|nr:RlmE family RNA methyltransferase [Planctomycetota bacterium]MEC8734200.1 RlmE family RNA methyltransferase [Planctomycetota bacterium]MEC8818756.1 RlmE family RNA methyltransferase [Planctomycetota bacterium]MEC9157347.1 RlmE family RNA methyltransferase [Planctomycetota bacterium]MEC9234566.1 RlmE family RNA methyltransferase [Planctomycetota bacterium]
MKELHDHFFRKAKKESFRSRAAYKLIEIDDKRRILGRGDLVVDCGAAPGSWLQVASGRVGPRGRVLGIDLKAIDPNGLPSNVQVVEGDVFEADAPDLLGGKADSVLSDMAPDTTGSPSADQFRSARLCEQLLDRLPGWLRPGGACVMKVFEGEAYPELLKRAGACFERAKGYKPAASRAESVEMFLVCTGFLGDLPPGAGGGSVPARPRPQRPAGW